MQDSIIQLEALGQMPDSLSSNPPEELRDVDEWVYCLDTTNDCVISWDRNNQQPKKVCDTFEKYVCDTILEAKEDWDDEE